MEKNKLMMIVIIILLIVLLGTVVAVSMYVLNIMKSQPTTGGNNIPQVSQGLTRDEITMISLGDPILTNLQVSEDGKTHNARITIEIGYDNTKATDSDALANMLNNQIKYARSIALACIYSKTFEELSKPDGMETLADEIKKRLQDEFLTTLIVDVNISDHILL